jgi:predicted MFS family arabinose efflux permease
VIGPAIGGVLIGVIGVAGCFAVNGASFLAVLLALLFMRADELRPAPRTPRPRTVADVLISLAEGVRFVARTPLIALCVFVIGVISGVAMNFNVIAPILARSVLEIGAPGLGLLMAAIGFGSLSGALTVAMLRQPRTAVIIGGAAALGVLSIVAGAVSGSGAPWAALVTGVALFGAGFGAIAMAATANAAIQTSTPPALRGRVMSVYTTVFAGSTPIGGLGTGAVVSLIGAPGALIVAGGLALIATAYAATRWRSIL